MLKSVVLIPQLIQEASQRILPAETLDYDSLSYKPLSTWESRVSASAPASYIWTLIPQNLRRLRGSTDSPFARRGIRMGVGAPENIVKSLLRTKFPIRVPIDFSSWHFQTAMPSQMWGMISPGQTQTISGSPGLLSQQFQVPSQSQSSSSRRGFLGGVLGRLFG